MNTTVYYLHNCYISSLFTFSWPTAMVMAAADVNPLITGTGMKSTRKPVDMTCTRSSSVVLDIVEW